MSGRTEKPFSFAGLPVSTSENVQRAQALLAQGSIEMLNEAHVELTPEEQQQVSDFAIQADQHYKPRSPFTFNGVARPKDSR